MINMFYVSICILGGKNKRSSDSGSFIPSGDGNQGLFSGGVRNTKLMSVLMSGCIRLSLKTNWLPVKSVKMCKHLQDGGEAGGSSNMSSPLNQTSITFMGFNITTMTGVQVYKTVITLLPLVPILVLLVQNTLYVNDLLAQQTSISSTESQVTWINFFLLDWVNSIFKLMTFDFPPSYYGIFFVFR